MRDKSDYLMIRLSPSMKKAFKKKAKQKKRPFAEILRELIQQYLEENAA